MLKKLLAGSAIALLLAACGDDSATNTDVKDGQVSEATAQDTAEASYPNGSLLVDAQWVNDNLSDDKLVIIDARSEGFEAGHIAGAIALPTSQLNNINNEVDGFLVGAEDFTKLAQSLGINEDSTVVVYDDGNALYSTRVFYALEYYGLKDQVKVLNGGYPAWLIEGLDVATDAEAPTAGNFVAKVDEKLQASREDVETLLNSEDVVIVDTRSKEEYTGEDLRKNANGGHIPGAVHQEWTTALQENEQGVTVFLDYEDLQKNYDAVGADKDKTIIPYCQTNVRGAHTYFSLRLLGYEDVRPYEGSWAEWGNTGDTVIES
ncbi:MAG: sulfurtransferase [Solibacillus sp.]